MGRWGALRLNYLSVNELYVAFQKNLLIVCLDLHVRIFPVFLGIIFPLISGSYTLPLSQQNIVGNGASRQETETDQTFSQWFAVGLTRFGLHLVQ